MKVTIDSTEPLADALRVIGALYNVTLSPTNNAGADKEPKTAPSPRSNAAAKRKRTRPATENKPTPRPERVTSKRTSRQASPVSTSEIRSWAKANGHAVNSRGTLPASIRSAYADVHAR